MQLSGGEIIAEYLIREKVPYVAGIPGHGCLGLVDAFCDRQDKIQVLQVRQEMAAVHLADGYYRMTGQPLAVFTSIGPGAMNTAIGVATCYVDSTAVLVLTGDTHTYMFGKGVLQEIERTHSANFPRVLEPIVKRWWRITNPKQLPFALQRAFAAMLTGRPGPVLIDLPMNVQCESVDVELPDPQFRRVTSGSLLGDTTDIEKAAELLTSAKRPVILAGGGVNLSGAWEGLIKIAERLDAAVITTFQGKGCFPEDHPLSALLGGSKGTNCGNVMARTADVLLAVGCRFADETTSSYRHNVTYAIPPTKVIHVDIDPAEIGKNYPVELGIVGDAKSVLQQLLDALSDRNIPRKDEYRAEIAQQRKEWSLFLARFRESDKVPVTMSRVLKETREFLDRDAVVVSSSGNAQAQILQEFLFYQPRTNLTTGGFSTMGWSLPAAIGAKLAKPDKQVIAVVGDGDFMMTMQELATAVQYNIPVVVLLVNNSSWISIRDLQIGVYGPERNFSCDFIKENGSLYSPDFVRIAEGFGCHIQKIERADEVKPALRMAFKANRPAVIEAIVNREFPYSGGLAVGWWDVPVPTYLEEKRKNYEEQQAEEVLY